MDDRTQDVTSYRAILSLVGGDGLEDIIRQVLDARGELPKAFTDELYDAVLGAELKGLHSRRALESASTDRLVRPLLKQLHRESKVTERLYAAVLSAWIQLQPTLALKASHFLIQKNIPPAEIWLDAGGFQGAWTHAELEDLTSLFLKTDDEHPEHEVALILCCLASRAPLAEEVVRAIDLEPETTSRADETHSIRDEWLGRLSALPADLPGWDQGHAFVDNVRQVADEKLTSRERDLHELQQALEALQGKRAWFDYFHLDRVDEWPSYVPVVQSPANLTQDVRILCDDLEKFAFLQAKYPNPTFTGDLRIHQQRYDLGTKIQSVYAQLQSKFVASTPPEWDLKQLLWDEEISGLEWDDWLSVLNALSPGDLFWESASAFCDRLATIIDAQRTALVDGVDLAAALDALQQFADLFDYFSLFEIADWSARTCVREDVDSVAIRVEELVAKLSLFQELRNVTPATFDEEQARDDLRRQTGREIAALYEETRASFALDRAPTDEALTEEYSVSEEPTVEVKTDQVADALSTDFALTGDVMEEVEQEAQREGTAVEEAWAEEMEKTQEEAAPSAVTHHRSADLFWSFVESDDLAGAYWLAESMAASGQSPVPSGLLAAVQASRLLHRGYNLSVESFLTRLVRSQQQPGDDDAETLLCLAAALRPTLFAPATGMIGWLSVPGCCPAFHDLVTVIQEFATFNIALGPDKLLDIADDKERERSVAEAALNGQRWLDNAATRRFKYRIASDVWLHLVTKGGSLQKLLSPVANDKRTHVRSIQEAIGEWKSDYDRRIDEAQRDLKTLKAHRIVGGVRQSLHRAFDDACQAGLDWCELVIQQQDIVSRGDWIKQQVEQLVDNLAQTLPSVAESLYEIVEADPRPDLVAAAHAASRSVHQLADDFRLTIEPPLSPLTSAFGWLVHDATTVEAALTRRLFLLPELPLSDAGHPEAQDLPHLALALERAHVEQRSLHTAFQSWLEKQDYRFTDTLINILGDQSPDAEEAYANQLQGSVSALTDHVRAVEEQIEQSLVDGIISEEAHSSYSAIVLAIDPQETRNFPATHQSLEQKVEAKLADAKQQRLSVLGIIWDELEARLESSNIQPADRDRIRGKVVDSLAQGDTRIVEEYLASLREALDAGQDRITAEVDTDRTDDFLDQFLERHADLTEAASRLGLRRLRDAIEGQDRVAGVSFRHLPTPRRAEAVNAIEAWRQLKKSAGSNRNNSNHIAELLRYLGFTIESRHSIVEQPNNTDAWLHMQVFMEASPQLVRPLPQFGSQRAGTYDVVAVWERPSMDTMSAWLHDLRLTNRAVILLYFGRMSLKARRYVASAAQEQGLTVATLDEVLLLFLATPQVALGSRLPAFLRCALPFAAINPYTPYKAGDVPPEMFFGRQEMARELLRADGSCLVYGGRQLGKSALLRHVQREFQHPERQQYASVEDIRLIGDPVAGQPTETVFFRMRDALKSMGVLKKQVTTDDPDRIRDYIVEAFDQNPYLRVLMMFDEADSFLEADSNKSFVQVWRLRDLMDRTNRRFKVILAGLQNVQRFQGMPNQPLAHFGIPLRVGPLEARPAQQLVKEPLESIGYRIDGPSVLRILSYTNYHPGLIQLFCHEMLRMLHGRASRLDPPYPITQDDVETVYRRAEVRDAIRERFNLTLALDTRYEAIACAMIVEQMDMRDSYAKSYPPGDILRLTRDWWPQGFAEASTQEARARLDEMCGLGVLVRDMNGHYRLKSPNLVRLMGDERDIEDRLLSIAGRAAPIAFDADSHHPWLDTAFSPFTYSQERSLVQPRYGVGLVFASDALGYGDLRLAYAQLVEGPDALGIAKRIPQTVSSGPELRQWLDRQVDQHSDYARFIAYHELRAAPDVDLFSLVETGLDYCQRRQQTRSRWVKIVFTFDPAATWQWLTLPSERRKRLENQADAVVTPTRWTMTGIKQRLRHGDVIDTEDVCQSILLATGGWHVLVDQLFAAIKDQFEPRPIADTFRDQLMSGDGEGNNFLAQAGLAQNAAVAVAARQIQTGILGTEYHDEGDLAILIELTTKELAERGSELTHQDIVQALAYLERMSCVSLETTADASRHYHLEPLMSQLLAD